MKIGKVAQKILNYFLSQSGRTIILTFDTYRTPSIKDLERIARGERRTETYHISGPDQDRPSNFLKALENIKFKEALLW